MSGQVKVREKRGKPSHRDDLRAELLAAAYVFVEREGHESLSMRRLADEIGVSSGAPYHHFPDRRSLLLAVALEGYRRMFEWDESYSKDITLPRGRIEHSCQSFLRFAMENGHIFTLMYESELVRPHLAQEIRDAQDAGFQRLHADYLHAAPGLTDRERAIRIATMWCAVFGFALQTNRQMIRSPLPEPNPDELAQEVVMRALRLLDD